MFLQSSNSSRPHSTSPCCSAASILTCCCAKLLHYQIPSFTSQNHWFVAFSETRAETWTWPQKIPPTPGKYLQQTNWRYKAHSEIEVWSLGALEAFTCLTEKEKCCCKCLTHPTSPTYIQSAAQKQHCFWCTSWHPSSNHKRVAVFSNSLDLPLVAGWLSSVDFEDQDQCWLRRSHWPQQVCVTTFPCQCKSKVKQFHLNQECNRGWLLCRDTLWREVERAQKE